MEKTGMTTAETTGRMGPEVAQLPDCLIIIIITIIIFITIITTQMLQIASIL
jgi:hypothetical protein